MIFCFPSLVYVVYLEKIAKVTGLADNRHLAPHHYPLKFESWCQDYGVLVFLFVPCGFGGGCARQFLSALFRGADLSSQGWKGTVPVAY